MNKLAAILALGIMVTLAPGANAITADGDWSDWFSYSGDVNSNNWREDLVTIGNANIRTQVDEEGPTPGSGGQLYDIEQIFYFFEDADPNALSGGRLHIGMVTGFPPEGVPSDDLYAGDMFIDFGNTGGGARGEFFDLAVSVSTRAGSDQARFGTVWENMGPSTWETEDVVITPFATSNPYRFADEDPGISPAVGTGYNQDVAWGAMGPHNFLEISLDVSAGLEDLLTAQDGGLGLHWTMQCGNDVINVQDNTPFAPVPEPSTMVLLGMGVVGGMLRKKFTA